MNCAYPGCPEETLKGDEERCPECSRLLRSCPHCGELNRAFANFCRACGRALGDNGPGWEGFKGGPERTGSSSSENEGAVKDLEEIRSLELKTRCQGLLTFDDHLIAVSQRGRVEMIDIGTRGQTAGWMIGGTVNCVPCVHRGSLFVGAGGSKPRIVAYTLGSPSSGGQHLEPRWEVAVHGIPIRALLAFDDRLYVNVAHRDSKRASELQIIDGIGQRRPAAARSVHASHCLSTPTGNSAAETRRVFFLSEENDRLTVHSADHGKTSRPPVSKRVVGGVPRKLQHLVALATVRHRIYAVFGDDAKLCTIDGEQGTFGSVIKNDVKEFALSGPGDGVLVQGGAVFFVRQNRREPLTPDERIVGPPVIARNRAAFVGMKDGRIRWYDLANPSLIGEKHFSDRPEEVTAMAAFGDYLAAGNSRGAVRLFRLVKK